MSSISIVICDDEELWRMEIRKCCLAYAKEHSLDFIITEYSSGRELIDGPEYDITFLDVEMGEENGLDIKNMLQRDRKETHIAFVSGHGEVMGDAFGRNVYGFITKPIDYTEFAGKLGRILADILEDSRTLLVNTIGKKCRIIYLKDVIYIEAAGKYSTIHTINEGGVFSENGVGFWENYLSNSGMMLCTRGKLVNLAYVADINDTSVLLNNGSSLDLSRRMKKTFKEVYKEYIWKKGI